MKLKNTEVVLLILGLLLSAIAIYTVLHHRTTKEETAEIQLTPRKIHGGPCPGETKTLKQNDPYMRGVLEEGQEYKVVINYYDCNPIKAGDLVLYSISSNMEPVVKIARAVEGDTFKTVKDKAHKAWNLLVNGEMILNETDHKPYFFGGEQNPTLSLYEKSHKNKLLPNEAIVLSSWAPGDADSGIFGLVSLVDIVGKVEKVKDSVSDKKPKQNATKQPVLAATPSPEVSPKASPVAKPKTKAKSK